jgi:hypothetical protein
MLLPGACVSTVSNPAKEAPAMSTITANGTEGKTASNSQAVYSQDVVVRLLELVRTSRNVADFTPDRLTEAFGVELQVSGDAYGHGAKVSPDWFQNFDYNGKYKRFRLSFDPVRRGESPDIAQVCHEFGNLTSELEGMGFQKQEKRGEHGRLVQYSFERLRDGVPEMRIEVTPESGIEDDAASGGSRACVRSIYIY